MSLYYNLKFLLSCEKMTKLTLEYQLDAINETIKKLEERIARQPEQMELFK